MLCINLLFEFLLEYNVFILFREFWNRKGVKRSPGAFVMSLSNKETELSESEGEEDHDLRMVTAKRFNCDDLYMRCNIKLNRSLNVDYMNYIWMIICLVFN